MAANFKIVPTLPVVDIGRAKKFYTEKLGCSVTREDPGPGAQLNCRGGEIYLYQRAPSKADHTLLDIYVENIESEMRDLRGKGVKFEEYNIPSMGLKTVNGVATMGNMKGSWFKDSEGNILGMTQLVKVPAGTR
jgi:catechol 2,3-dioxygenase-like lactoylglutathione lyase family enzyme